MSDAPPMAVLLMGYGSPSGAADLTGYLTDVLRGRPPSPAMVREYERRYALIGGSPQNAILASLRTKLERRLARSGAGPRVYLGTKHWVPNIATVVPQMAADGVRRAVAVPLSPYASTWILEPYRATLAEGVRAARSPIEVELKAGWHLDPDLIGHWARSIRASLADLDDPTAWVHLSAHSLPKRFRDAGDPYPEILAETSQAIAAAAGLVRWGFTFQSAGNTTEPWLGPDITERMVEAKARGATAQLVASFGFVFDHLETLYDLDVEVRAFAERHGIAYHRVPMPNDADAIAAAIARTVERPVAGERFPAGPA